MMTIRQLVLNDLDALLQLYTFLHPGDAAPPARKIVEQVWQQALSTPPARATSVVLSASWQRTFANTEAKYLMLKYAFETLHCIRVQFTTDEINEKSHAAILRLGAKQEGIVRNERIMPDGRKRNSVRFSIIDEEWPQLCIALEQRLGLV